MTELGSQPLVLVIEDEAPIRRFLRATLQAHEFRYREAVTGGDGLRAATLEQPDLIILDLGLPDIDGLQVIAELRSWASIPIIVLSARGREQDKIAALDAGADDYLTKPFGTGELLARIRVSLRHHARSAQPLADTAFRVGGLRVDLVRRHVWVDDAEVHLTPIEYRMLSTLIRHAGQVVTHRQLLTEVWGPGYGTEAQYLRVYIGQLRRKIEREPARPYYLMTELGVGYRLRDEE
ncbi:response regulator [Chloroflexia bacterium SDU3-3]|nr:response regulator [Chloroflexia bacterium SDU3-3]